MARKKNIKRRSNRKKPRHVSMAINPKSFSRVMRFLTNNLIAVIAILVTIIVSFTTYYLSYSEPDIHGIHDATPKIESYEGTIDEMGNKVGYCRVKVRFKNLSIKNGYIDKVELIPKSIDVRPKVEIKYIEKEVLHWGEEKEIELHFVLTITPYMYNLMFATGKGLVLDIIPYDNTGKLIKDDDMGYPLNLTFHVGAPIQ